MQAPLETATFNHNRVPDKGPWQVGQDSHQVWLDSEDFTHDVRLTLSGDFEGPEAARQYAHYLAEVLTAGCVVQQGLQVASGEASLLEALQEAAEGPSGHLLLAAHQEIARLQAALAQATEQLAAQPLASHAQRQLQQVATPSAFALALQRAIAQGTKLS